jgi:hypothetical protein
MAMAMTFIGAAFTAWALMWLITTLDAPDKKKEPQSSGNYSRARYGR